MQRDELLQQIEQQRGAFETLLSRFSRNERDQAVLANGWSIKDLLGHLGFWQERVVSIYHHLTGGPQPVPGLGALDVDELNAQVYAANHARTLVDVVQREQTSYQALLELIRSVPEADLFDVGRFSWTQGRPFMDWIEGNSSGHYQEHLADLRGHLGLPGVVAYAAAGKVLHGYAAQPARGAGPGVIVLHAWWGLNPFFQRLCDRLAEQGFVVFAPDLNDGKIAQTVAEASALMAGRDFGGTKAAVLGAVEQIRRQPGVGPGLLGVIGFSMGAAWTTVLSTARPAEIGAAVLFYGGEHLEFTTTGAAYLGHFAEQDEWEPDEGIRQLQEELKAAGREATFYRYPGTGHWFFEDDRPDAYQPEAAALAWERTLAFLREKLG